VQRNRRPSCGLVVAVAAPPPVGEYAAVVSEAWLEERQADENLLKKRTAAVSAFLAGRVLSADVSNEYPEAGWADDTIGRRAATPTLRLLDRSCLPMKR
jgi:hypothetical protein